MRYGRGAYDMGTGAYVGELARCTAPHPLGSGGVRFRFPCDKPLPVPPRTKVRADSEGPIECPHPDCPARYSISEVNR